MSFSSLGLSSFLLKALETHKYKKPFPIQKKAIPAILKYKDVLGIAKTGSGKTASYVLPVLMNLEGKTNTKNRHINVLVLVPTRELAVQVESVFKDFGEALPFHFRSFAVYGGVSINPQMKNLNHINVLVATLGRLLDLVRSNAIHFDSLSTLVLDEADKILNLGFKKELDEIISLLPHKRQNLLFSATLSPDVSNITQVLLKDPEVIQIEEADENLDLLQLSAYKISQEKKGPLLRHIINEKNIKQVLVFTSSVYQADHVSEKLIKNGIHARAIHSKKSQGSRTTSLTEFKAGRLSVLVATDLLARGIDIQFLPLVINYELPRSPKDFIHRVGRTGRAERPGEAISFVTPDAEHHFKVIQKKINKTILTIEGEEIV